MEPDILLLLSLKYSIGSSSEVAESISHRIPVSSILILSQVIYDLLLSDNICLFLSYFTCVTLPVNLTFPVLSY